MAVQERDKNDDPYSTRYIAFVDILGFSEIVAKHASPERAAQRLSLVKTLQSIGSRELDKTYGDDFRLQQFSDSIIVSDKESAVGLFNLLDAIADLAGALLANELLIRGGIAKGLLHHDGQIVFGPAFLEAYRIESSIAKFPRVVLSSAVMEDARKYLKEEKYRSALNKIADMEDLHNLIRLSDDGPAFVHVFHDIDQPFASIKADKATKAISNLLRNAMHEPSHYEKLKWLAVYWNASVAGTNVEAVSLDRSDWFY